MITQHRNKLEPFTEIVSKPFMYLHPNIISLLGLVPPVLFCYFVFIDNYLFASIAFLGLGFDFVDGTVARKRGLVSKFGELLDASLDRVTDFMMFAIFGLVGIVKIELVLLVILLSYLISYIRSKAELASKATIKLNVGIIERPERLALLGLGFVVYAISPEILFMGQFNILEVAYIFIAILSFITVLQRLKKASDLL